MCPHAENIALPEKPKNASVGRFLLTAPQMALWLDQALHPRKPIYNTGQVLALGTAVNTGLFAEALARVVAEHDALRLRFVQRGAEIFQEVVTGLVPHLDLRDFSGEAHPATAAEAWLEQIFWEPIAPTDFPLFRFALAKVDSDRFLWLQTYHHLIIDATGRQLVAARMAAVYDTLAAGAAPPHAETGSYRRLKAAEGDYLASATYAEDEAYWRTRFANLPAPLVHRSASLSEKMRSGRPVRLDCGLTGEETTTLRAFARRHGSSAFKVILTIAWCCFSRLYQQTDLVFGVPLANRKDPLVKRTVGLFSTVMPFRLSLDAAAPVSVALTRLDEKLSEDLKHQAFPTDHINRLLELRRLNRGGLYDVVVNYVRNDYSFDFGGARITCTNLSAGFAVPWSIMALEYGPDDPIRLVIDYDQGRVDPAEAAQLVRAFRGLLSRLANAGDVAIGQLLSGPEAVAIQHPEAIEGKARPSSAPLPAATASAIRRPPRDDIDKALLAIWQRYFPDRDIGIDADYFDLGGDSLRAVLLAGECNLRMGCDLPLSVLFEGRTVERVADAFRDSIGRQTRSCFVRMQEGYGGAPLLLVHPIGGTLICYRDLVTRLGKDLPIYGMQASGLHEGERLPDSIEEMVEDYLHAAEAIVERGPLHLAGWSFGGFVAFAMACRLAELGSPAATLTMIDTPLQGDFQSDDEDGAMLRVVARTLGIGPELPVGSDLATSIQHIAAATAPQPGAIGMTEDQVARMIDLVRNTRRLRRNYRPPRLSGRATLFRASMEPEASQYDFDWSGLIDGPLDVLVLPATHDSIVRPPHVDQIATILAGTITGGRDDRRP